MQEIQNNTVARILARVNYCLSSQWKPTKIEMGAAEWVNLCAAIRKPGGNEPTVVLLGNKEGTEWINLPVEVVGAPEHLRVHFEGWV